MHWACAAAPLAAPATISAIAISVAVPTVFATTANASNGFATIIATAAFVAAIDAARVFAGDPENGGGGFILIIVAVGEASRAKRKGAPTVSRAHWHSDYSHAPAFA